MAKIKLHNPELAANSKFSNLVIESLNTDPAVSGIINVGRIWFNNTDKTFKGTFLNAAGTDLEVKTIGDSSQLTVIEENLNTEIATREAADIAIQGDIDTISSDLTTETTTRENDDMALQGSIDTISSDLSTEITDRISSDDDLTTRIESINSAVGIDSDTYTTNGTANYISTAISLKDADNELDTALKTEETDRISADTALDTRVTDIETAVDGNIGDLTTLTTDTNTDLVSAINEIDANTDTVSTDLATETTNRTSADTTLQGNIDTVSTAIATETTNRTTADTTLQGNIDTLETDVQTNYLNKTTSTAQVVTADTTFQGDMVISGNLTVSGASTTVETEILKVADNIITLNNGIGAVAPTENAGLEVDRGNEGTTTILNWNEALDQVEVQEAGELRKVATTNYVDAEVASAAGDISALDTRLTTAETNITSNDGDISTLQTALATETTNRTSADTTLQGNIDTVSTALATETTNRTSADTTLQGNIDTVSTALATETANRTTADTALDGRITTLESAVGSNIGDLSTLTTDTQTDLVSAINEVDAHADTNASDIASEITDRAAADTLIQAELDATQAGSGLGTDGTYTADVLTNYITTATDLANADKLLDGQIKTNADTTAALDTRVTTVESQVNGNIGDLTALTTDTQTDLVAAINEVDAHIDAEVTNRTTADTTLQTNITAEETARTTADTALSTRIDNVNTAVGITGDTYTADATTNYLTGATDLMNADNILDTTIKTTIDNLAATTATNGTTLIGYEGYTEVDTNIVNPTIEIAAGTLKDSIDDIVSSVNAKIHEIENRYVKGEVADVDKSDTYTIAHNLDTEFVDVSVQVYDADETVWRFDLVVTEVIDVNTVKISLASGTAEQIRYVIQGY